MVGFISSGEDIVGRNVAFDLMGSLLDLTVAMVTSDDDPDVLADALERVGREGLAHPAIVVDMSRRNGVSSAVERAHGVARLVRFSDSRGVSDSRNRAVREATTRYILFLDADALPEPGWAKGMRQAFDEVERVAIVGARCLPRWVRRPPRLFATQPAGDFLSLFDLGDQPLDVPRIIGTSYALDRERLSRDPFPVELGYRPGFQYAGEENVLAQTARRDGWRVRYEPGAIVRHRVPPNRLSWRSMAQRAYRAGRESHLYDGRLEPLPRQLTLRDHAFLALISPAYLAGRVAGLPAPRAGDEGDPAADG